MPQKIAIGLYPTNRWITDPKTGQRHQESNTTDTVENLLCSSDAEQKYTCDCVDQQGNKLQENIEWKILCTVGNSGNVCGTVTLTGVVSQNPTQLLDSQPLQKIGDDGSFREWWWWPKNAPYA